jgi:hypothetical protein
MPNSTIPNYIAGGYDKSPAPTILDHYAFRRLGPRDVNDAVIFSAPIDASVVPGASTLRYLPKGRVFSMTAAGTFVPGVSDSQAFPVAALLVGSDSNSGDVIGVQGGDPALHADAYVPFKDEANAPFQSLLAGYIYETTEYDPTEILQLVPGTPVTADGTDITDFDNAGLVKVGQLYVDHIIGVVVSAAAVVGINHSVRSICIQGTTIPRILSTTIASLRS